MHVRPGVVVQVRHVLTCRRLGSRVPGCAQPLVLGPDEPEAELTRDRSRLVGGAVVDDDHLHVRVVDLEQALAGAPDRLRAVVRADDDGNARPGPLRERRGRVRGPNCPQRWLRPPLPVGEPEVPVVDVVSAAVPLVRPREHERARAPGGEGLRQLPAQALGLLLEPVAPAVEPDLCEEKRPVSGEVLQPSEVRRELLGRLQVHVEREQIEERKLEVLARRVVDVGDEPVGIPLLGRPVEALEKALDARTSVPANDRRRNLVADGVGEHRRVALAGFDGAANALRDRLHPSALVEERDVLLPGQPDEHIEAVLGRLVEKPQRRRRVRAEGVDAHRRHRREVPSNAFRARELLTVVTRPERAVGNALHPQLLATDGQELAAHARALCDRLIRTGAVRRRRVLERALSRRRRSSIDPHPRNPRSPSADSAPSSPAPAGFAPSPSPRPQRRIRKPVSR